MAEKQSSQKEPYLFLKKTIHAVDWRRLILLMTGFGLFLVIFYAPDFPVAVAPSGKQIILTHQGKAALGLFFLAATWWIFEVIPIGVTSITIAVVQSLFFIRDSRVAFTDFMDPSVWFIIGSIVIGLVFTKTGLAKRMAYRMLILVGERTSMLYLGSFVMTASLTLIMAHTAVAATVYPLFMAVYALYGEGAKPTRFGKGLFMGMAYTAGAGSIITLLGAARGAVAIGFFKDIVGREIQFFELTYYLFPIGVVMVFVLWAYLISVYKPEKKTIPGLRTRAKSLSTRLGPISVHEKLSLLIVFAAIIILSLRSFVPVLDALDKSAVLLTATILFFVFKILTIKDLQSIPWNIILLFGGAMSIGFCLWQTGAAEWMAIQWLVLFQDTHWFVFLMAISFFVLLLTNFIMNVAAIAIFLPVAFIVGGYLNVAPEVILFASLTVAGMPFLLLVGAAPNAIAYNSNQFSVKEFFLVGIPASILLLVVLGFFMYFIWPVMGMPIVNGI